VKIESKLVLTSKNFHTGANLYTFVLTYPRVILAEVNTHRMLSRNTASSRAIPSFKQRERVLDDPFVPYTIGQNQKGMQAGEELSGWRRAAALGIWKAARYPNVLASWALDKIGAHKQVVNRVVEPWTWTQQVVTCTDLRNVFKLRNHKDAEPHFHILAEMMQRQVEHVEWLYTQVNFDAPIYVVCPRTGIGQVQTLVENQWHTPFIDLDEYKQWPTETCKKVSTARCARVSYFLPEDGTRSTLQRDVELMGRLSQSGHWSPFEHVATPSQKAEYVGNFFSWKQYRKEFPEEHGGDRA